MLRIVIGLQNYNGVACGVNFEKSVGQDIPEDWTRDHVQVKRLLALFPGTTVEDVGVGKAVAAKKPDPTPQPKAEPETAEEPAVAEEPETSAPAEDAEEAPVADPVEEEETEEVAEEVEEVEEPEEPEPDDEEKQPLGPGDDVLAHYKGEFRKGKVVKVLESGVVRVNIDGDDAQYRVLDDDKVSKLDPEAAE